MEGEWLNGLPHGICIIEDQEGRGVTTFVHGKINGPSWVELKEDGTRTSFEYMNEYDGEPKGFFRGYASDKSTSHVDSTTNQIPTPGWMQRIIKVDPSKQIL